MTSLIVKVRYPEPGFAGPPNPSTKSNRETAVIPSTSCAAHLLCNRLSVVAKASKQALIRELPDTDFLE